MDKTSIKMVLEYLALLFAVVFTVMLGVWEGTILELNMPIFYGSMAVLALVVWATFRIERKLA